MSPTPSNPRGAIDLSDLAAKAQQSQPAAGTVAGQGAPAGAAGASYLVELTEQNFEAEARKSLQYPIIVELTSISRVPAEQQMAASLDELASESGGKFSVARVDMDSAPQLAQALAQAFGVQGIPAVGGLLQGQPVGLAQGVLPKDQLKQLVDELLKAALANGIAGRAEPVSRAALAEADSDEPDPRFAAADEALARGDYAAAVEEFDKLLQANPKDAEAEAGKAQASLLLRTADADPQALIAAAAAPDAPIDTQLAAADAEVATGRVEEAFARLIAVIKKTAGDDRNTVRVRLLELFETVGNSDPRVQKARRDLMAALF
ncbi:tetratricopeptide repeat protein [Microlunatus elymi]|nr:tetratricopeptide repeat protein [Microlunatus elymi]